jgi:MinD-like ATPase involved in chromosome partitioning or flagellar assembly
MAEEVETTNGRHWSELDEVMPAESSHAVPLARQPDSVEGNRLPGPPTSLTPVNEPEEIATVTSARPTPPPVPPSQERSLPPPEPAPAPTAGPRPGQPHLPWGHPAPPAQPAQWGAPPPAQPQWGVAPERGQGQTQWSAGREQSRPSTGPIAAPRRQAEAQAFAGPDVTQQIPTDPRLRTPGPNRQAATRGPAESEQYRRPGAPMQAASAGIRQELVAVANEERLPVANTGLRGTLNKAGLKLKPGKKEKRRREVYARIRAPKDSMYAVAVLTLKGGAGKTTITGTLGQVFAKIRPDGVIAVDADPDAGDLPMRTASHPRNLSMVDMLAEVDLGQYDLVQRFLSTTETDLQVLANGWRPDNDRVLVPEDVIDVREILSHYYSLLLWDGDKALNSAVVRAMLDNSNALVLIVEASRPGAMKAGQAIDWLRNHGYEGLLARTVLVVNETTANTRLDMESLMTVLARQQLKIHHIPFDPHLDEGLLIDLDKLKKKTRRAFEDLAAMLADDFSVPQPPAAAAAAEAAAAS